MEAEYITFEQLKEMGSGGLQSDAIHTAIIGWVPQIRKKY